MESCPNGNMLQWWYRGQRRQQGKGLESSLKMVMPMLKQTIEETSSLGTDKNVNDAQEDGGQQDPHGDNILTVMMESCCTQTHTPLDTVTPGLWLQLLSFREDMSLSVTGTELED